MTHDPTDPDADSTTAETTDPDADSITADTTTRKRPRVAFVCVQNAGRSQMAYAFAERERSRRGLGSEIELLTGGTRPADRVHLEVVEAMAAVGIDVSERRPRAITFEEIQSSGLVITMGCSAEDVCPAGWSGENRDWGLPDPDGESSAAVSEIRDEIERRVADLFDELESTSI